jgi:hypothetical protein
MTFFKASAALAVVLAVAACNQPTSTPATPGAPATPGMPAPATPGAPATTGGLTGADRDSFVNASTSSCVSTAQADPRNASLGADVIQQYCSCYSNKMADSISPSEAQSLNTADATRIQQVLGPRIQAAVTACKPSNM